MTDPPPPATPGAGQQLQPPRRQYRLSDYSPNHNHAHAHNRTNDELLNRLTPMTAVEMLQSPSTELKQCLDNCTVSEQEFAMRAAVASRKIYEWLEELSDWPWPESGGSVGFEMPDAKRRKLSGQDDGLGSEDGPESEYMGSLPAEDVIRYEGRVDGISHDMDELQIEDIKSHVMHSHIIPLSRPGTPVSDTRSISSMLSYNRMDDLTALLTAIIIQALPNLSKLCRLLKVWHIRLSVLRRIPALLAGIAEAEFALQSAWNVLSSPANTPSAEDGTEDDDLSRLKQAYTVVKSVLEKQITKSGRSLDYMLDSLEGLQDTLPDDWLDRMETIERSYAEWVSVGERKIREGEWAKLMRPKQSAVRAAEEPAKASVNETTKVAARIPVDKQANEVNNESAKEVTRDAEAEPRSAVNSLPVVEDDPRTVTLPVPIKINLPEDDSFMDKSETNSIIFHADATPEQSEGSDEEAIEVSPSHFQAQKKTLSTTTGLDGSSEALKPKRAPLAEVRNEESTKKSSNASTREGEMKEEIPLPVAKASLEEKATMGSSSSSDEDEAVEILSDTPESEDEIELPPLIRPERRGSNASQSSTVIFGHTSLLAEATSDVPEVSASPPLPRQRPSEVSRQKAATERFMNISPPSSPPFRPTYRQDSASPMIGPQGDGLLPALPLESSFMEEEFDTSFTNIPPPREPSDLRSDDHLRQQISDILDSIPANIKLASGPPKINLNPPPPDLPAKRLKKPSREPIRRSASSLSMTSRASSRATTPFLTLAPAYAKNPRPKRPQSRQDIKVYHLSRSTGEAPIKLFIRCVGENGERVMVRVGGGWADLGEYLKEYAAHHGRRSTGRADKAKVEIQDIPRPPTSHSRGIGSSPQSRPASAMDMSPMTPLHVRKARKSFGAADLSNTSAPMCLPQTPAVPPIPDKFTPSSEDSNRSRASSHAWAEEDSSFLGLAGPTGRKVEMSEESRAWVESVKEKVRLASGETRKNSEFGEMGKVGGTKRLFRKG
ncbi:GAS2 domain-containing protein [Colletotrichum karsti]|uniref:GAS2 domain-containing protein n=1 Tax=Colletotrichum karsti TaxID=1095194 RepID=A0A9P6I6D9_9PEZI|nr:GAS2 domain-containing protein [Colletotrichum karsti]KAF9874806.1 GAS2 domain-containing protein [Colletotrichum karsti]